MGIEFFLGRSIPGVFSDKTRMPLDICEYCRFGDWCNHPEITNRSFFPRIYLTLFKPYYVGICSLAESQKYTDKPNYRGIVRVGGNEAVWVAKLVEGKIVSLPSFVRASRRDDRKIPTLCGWCFYLSGGECVNAGVRLESEKTGITIPHIMRQRTESRFCGTGAMFDPSRFMNRLRGVKQGIFLDDVDF
jgi:hypothetical protein